MAIGTAVAAAPAVAAPDGELAVKTGDVIVFVGDELTEMPAARWSLAPVYPLLVETFLTGRYPELRAQYINVGWNGDTTQRVLLRLERDVLVHRPTVVVICLGLNDPGYLAFAADRLEGFKEELTTIAKRCHEAGARTWLLSPPSVEEHKGKKVRVTRDGRPAVVDLQAIRYNETLARYAAAVKEIAEKTDSGFVDWYASSLKMHSKSVHRSGSFAFTRDGRIPQLRSSALVASKLLRAWGARPIRVAIELDWKKGHVQVTIDDVPAESTPAVITEDGKRIIELQNLPLPWPLPGGTTGSLQPGWEATSLCEFMFQMADPPERGIVLVQEAKNRGTSRQLAIIAAQLRAGFNLATAEPLSSLEGARELSNLIGVKNGTRHTVVWRRLQLSPPREPELAEAHGKLIDAWQAYVAGYEELIANYPRRFDARVVLTEAAETERLPTSRPVRTRPAPAKRPHRH